MSINPQPPADWQKAHAVAIHLLQGQQAQMEELVRVPAQEAEACIMIFSRQQ